MNLKDLAAHLQLAASTVSRVLAGRGDEFRISTETQRRIQDAAVEYGVRIDPVGRGLRLRRTGTIGLVVPDIANPFFAALAGAVERQARLKGYAVLLADSQESTDVEAAAVQALLEHRVDGFILAPVGGDGAHLVALAEKRVPLVQVDRVISRLPTPAVKADNFFAAQEAVRWLVALGHRRIACVQARADSTVIQDRLEGYRAGLREAGISLDEAWIGGSGHSVENGRREALRLLALTPRPSAVLALSNLLALGVLEAAQERGLDMPRELSLVSFDEQPWAALLKPSLSTLEQPVEAMGTAAVELLQAQMNPTEAVEAASEQRTLPVVLRRRGSVAQVVEP
ncbi:MAG: LacI family DNA-binding transcriptional regulator [Prosthecobacter sp.]